MKLIRKILALFIAILVAVFLLLKFSDHRTAKIARSYLATNFPAIFSSLQRLPVRPLAERLSEKGFTLGQPLLIRVFKEENILEVWINRNGQFDLALSYPICAWSGELGPKVKEATASRPKAIISFPSEILIQTRSIIGQSMLVFQMPMIRHLAELGQLS